jgi:hypothetical protein
MINKRFKNDDGAIETTLIGLIFSLTFSSLVIAFLLVQAYGYNVTGDESSIVIPTTGTIDGMQDYKTNKIIDNVNYVSGIGQYVFNTGIGRVLTSNPSGIDCFLLLSNVALKNDEYTINYEINNSVQQNYGVAVRYWTDTNLYNVKVYVKNDGFHIPNGLSDLIETDFYPFPNANQYTKASIKTVFNENLGTLKFYFNGALVFTKTGISKPIITGSKAYYAGVLSKTLGFTVESINVGSFNFDSGDILSQIGGFLDVLFRIIVWNVNPQFLPNELNILFIKTQLFGIIICAIMIIRGN